MSKELLAISEDRIVGRIEQLTGGRLQLTYDEAWQNADDGYPISLSMPMTVRVHADASVRPFLEGLLPDNSAILQQWGRRYGVSANNPFALLTHVGEDCAGAVQFVPAGRVDELTGGTSRRREVKWLTEADVANRLRTLRTDAAAWRLSGDTGQFSLAGAHPKTALLFDGERWGVPSGRTPTTHILKPPVTGFDGFVENEHMCLDLARTLGLPAARSAVVRFEDQVAIAVERFDRRREGARWVRVHQEDFCQSLAVRPEIKYQNQGGPGTDASIELLRSYSSMCEDDVWTFLRALMFNWLIAGTDAHAKNYGVLIGAGSAVRLAPLYDMASALPYPIAMPRQKIKLAMTVGREYLVSRIVRSHWVELATRNGLDPSRVITEGTRLAAAIPDAIRTVQERAAEQGLSDPVVAALATAATVRARACAELLDVAR